MYPIITGFLLLLLLLAAAWHDIRSRRIPNALVYTGAITGVLVNTLLPQEMGGLGALDSLAGLGAGLLLLLPLYLLRAMGAGDVKLMSMVGAFLGARGVTGAFMCVLLAGGLLALVMVWRQGKLSMSLRKLKMALFFRRSSTAHLSPMPREPEFVAKFDQLPYGVAIAAGTAAYFTAAIFG